MPRHTLQIALLGLFCLFSLRLGAQQTPLNASDTLSLDAAIEMALGHNHALRQAHFNLELAENSAQPGQAGYYPTLTAGGSFQYAVTNNQFDIANQDERVVVRGAEQTTFAANLTATYTIFNGFARRATYQQLQSLSEESRKALEISVENTVVALVEAYLEVARATEALTIAQNTLEVSDDRLARARAGFELGGRTRLELLNAQVDINTDSVNLANAQLQLDNARRNLNFLLGLPPSAPTNVQPAFQLTDELSDPTVQESLIDEALSTNATLAQQRARLETAQRSLEIQQAGIYPRLDANVAYNYSRTENEGSFLTFQRNNGPTATLSLSWTLFDGFRRRTAEQNAQLTIRSSQVGLEQIEEQLTINIENALATYRNSAYIYQIDQRNLATAELNFTRTEEAYKLGQATSTEFREAQLNLALAQNRINNSRIALKRAELTLLQLSGRLVTTYNE